jgi:hypothetical protein
MPLPASSDEFDHLQSASSPADSSRRVDRVNTIETSAGTPHGEDRSEPEEDHGHVVPAVTGLGGCVEGGADAVNELANRMAAQLSILDVTARNSCRCYAISGDPHEPGERGASHVRPTTKARIQQDDDDGALPAAGPRSRTEYR